MNLMNNMLPRIVRTPPPELNGQHAPMDVKDNPPKFFLGANVAV